MSDFRCVDLGFHLPRLTAPRSSCLPKRPGTYGLIKKVGHRYEYDLTKLGRRVLVTMLDNRASVVLFL